MDRSIKKSISVGDFQYRLQAVNVAEEQKAKLLPALFENPKMDQSFILKDGIYTLADIKRALEPITEENDQREAIIEAFYVNDDLPIPKELRRLFLSNSKQAFFVGAGVSKLLGIPLWDELAKGAVEHLKEKNYLNFSEAGRLCDGKLTAKQLMTIFYLLESHKSERRTFYAESLRGKDNTNGNPYELLLDLEEVVAKPIIRISTNIDLKWEDALKARAAQKNTLLPDGKPTGQEPLYKGTQLLDFHKGQIAESGWLYQIHGSMNALDSIVATAPQYINSYRDDDGLKGFLEEVFRTHSVLFIGSSMQEFEIMEHCLKGPSPRHYAFLGGLVGDDHLFRVQKKYFSQLNIEAIPYYLDFQGHDRLLFVLRSWVDEIRAGKDRQYYEDIMLLDEVLKGHGR